MFRISLIALATLSLSLGGACSKKDDGGGGSSGSGPETIELSDLGLVGEAPAGSKVGDALVGEGVMVQGPGLVANVAVAEGKPETAEAAREEADMYSPKNIETEELEDGWTLTYENEGSAGANYFLEVRREIGGKAYWCDTTAPQKEQQQNALAFCKSLSQ